MTSPSVYAASSDPIGRANSVGQTQADLDMTRVLRAKKGDQAAYAQLWETHWRGLFRFFVRQGVRREEAEDLASDTLLAAFDQIPAFRGLSASDTSASDATGAATCSFQSFLYTIARNKMSRWIRRKSYRPCDFTDLTATSAEDSGEKALEERLGVEEESDPLQTLLQQNRLEEVCFALADVGARSSEQFKALFLHYFCELPHKEVASLLEARGETINTRLQEGRRTLTRYYNRTNRNPKDNTASAC